MLGWLVKKGQQSRVYMCIKEVMWELQSSDSVRRAMILAIASVLRVKAIEGSGIPHDILDRPLDYSRDDLMRFYGQLEDIRNANTLQIQHVRKTMRRLGEELPEFAVQHARNTGRGLEVWMCTIAAGIAVDRRDDVRDIWRLMISSKRSLLEAFKRLRATEQRTAEMTGVAGSEMFIAIEDQSWFEACRFVPSVFIKELQL